MRGFVSRPLLISIFHLYLKKLMIQIQYLKKLFLKKVLFIRFFNSFLCWLHQTGQADKDVGPPYIYGNRKVIWNPRFLNPENDPDFNDFDKSGWNVAAGGSGEYIHHKVSQFSLFYFLKLFFYLISILLFNKIQSWPSADSFNFEMAGYSPLLYLTICRQELICNPIN